MTVSDLDPRLITDQPGLAGAWASFRRRLSQGELGSLPVLVGVAVIWAIFAIANPNFLTPGNLTNLVLQLAATGTISLGWCWCCCWVRSTCRSGRSAATSKLTRPRRPPAGCGQLASSARTLAAWPSALTLCQARSMRPCSSTRKVERSTPMLVWPNLVFSPQAP